MKPRFAAAEAVARIAADVPRAAALIALALAIPFHAARAQVEVSAEVEVGAPVEVETFHSRLSHDGRWVHVHGYNDEVWIPATIHQGWRPYSDGRWVMTEYGWTFVSDDRWGWATWHYGNWQLTDDAGWVWVPGRTWAPAWVSWRYGGGYAAWAPLPAPGFRTSYYAYNSPAWVCVPQAHFTQPIATVVVNVNVSARYVQNAQPLAGPVRAGGIGVNPGPRAEVIAQATGQPVRAVSAHAVVGHGTASIDRAPPAPHASPAIAHAMNASWSHQQLPANNRAAQPNQPGRPGQPNGASAQHNNLAPAQKPAAPANAMPPRQTNSPAQAHANGPADAEAQKAQARQQVQNNQEHAQEQNRLKQEQPSGERAIDPAPNQAERINQQHAQDTETNQAREASHPQAPARAPSTQSHVQSPHNPKPAQHAAPHNNVAHQAPHNNPQAHPAAPHPAGRSGGEKHP